MFGVLLVKYSRKNTEPKKQDLRAKKVLVWAVISYTGPRCLYLIEGKENTDVYEWIMDECLPGIIELC
jgi:hypothetical protein